MSYLIAAACAITGAAIGSVWVMHGWRQVTGKKWPPGSWADRRWPS